MWFRVTILRTLCLAFVGIQIAACSASHSSAVPQERRPSFATVIGNGGCSDPVGGCPIGWLCWDGSDPDPFYGSCPPAPPVPPGPQPTPKPACDKTVTTVAPTPTNRTRTTLGVGEQVDLSSNGTWTVTGNGSLNTTSPATDVQFTAGDFPGDATVTASGPNCLAVSIKFSIIKPSGLLYVAFGGVRHTIGLSDIGMQTTFYLLPATVSFANLTFLESNDTTMAATGPWACGNNSHGHGANPNPVPVRDNVPGIGSPAGTDEAYIGSCDGADQFAAGSASFNIQDTYYGPGGGSNQFTTIAQVATADGMGNLSIAKVQASRATTVNSQTSGY